MSQIEAPGGQFAKHRELRVFVDLLWYIALTP